MCPSLPLHFLQPFYPIIHGVLRTVSLWDELRGVLGAVDDGDAAAVEDGPRERARGRPLTLNCRGSATRDGPPRQLARRETVSGPSWTAHPNTEAVAEVVQRQRVQCQTRILSTVICIGCPRLRFLRQPPVGSSSLPVGSDNRGLSHRCGPLTSGWDRNPTQENVE